jgi:hypothetical protein
MKTFFKMFSESGSGGEVRIQEKINSFAQTNNVDIVSTSMTFRKGLCDADMIFVGVVFSFSRKDGK